MNEMVNLDFDIKAKLADMVKSAEKIIKKDLILNSNSEPSIQVCLAYNVKKFIPALLDAMDALEAERNSLKAQCEAYERALESDKTIKRILCKNYGKDDCDLKYMRCNYCKAWQFDEARFSNGGDST